MGLRGPLQIIPHAGDDGLARSKLLPSRRTLRAAGDGEAAPTPRYNNRVLEDILMLSAADDVRACVSSNPSLAEATWPQRRLDYVFVSWPRPAPLGNIESAHLAGVEAVDGVTASDHWAVVVDLVDESGR